MQTGAEVRKRRPLTYSLEGRHSAFPGVRQRAELLADREERAPIGAQGRQNAFPPKAPVLTRLRVSVELAVLWRREDVIAVDR